jgi:hypothetical protein
MFLIYFLLHVMAAVSVGPILVLPFLTRSPALMTVLTFLRFSAAAVLLTGIALWLSLGAIHPAWLVTAFALFVVLAVVIAFVIDPAAERIASDSKLHARVLGASIASVVLTLAIITLMVLKPW